MSLSIFLAKNKRSGNRNNTQKKQRKEKLTMDNGPKSIAGPCLDSTIDSSLQRFSHCKSEAQFLPVSMGRGGASQLIAVESFDMTTQSNDTLQVLETSSESYRCEEPMSPVIRYIPRWMRFENDSSEANGLAVDIYGRATIAMSSMFLGPALLELANQAAQEACATAGSETCDENARIYGFRPSSLLSNIAIASGLLCSVFLPFVGAVVDHTPLRRQVGAYSGAALVFLKGFEICVSEHTWFPIAFLQVLAGALYSFHNTSIFAYTSDLSSDAKKQAAYNTSLYVVMFTSTLIFLVLVLVPSTLLQLEDVGTARVSQTVTTLTTAVCFSFAWTWLFRDRPALSQVPPGMTLWSSGFYKNLRTVRRIHAHFPALMWLMAAVAFGEAASSALVTIATTFMKEVLQMKSSEISIVFFVVLVSGIPGSKIAGYLAAQHWNPLQSIILCNLMFMISSCLAAVMLVGPEVKQLVYIFGVFWGAGLGWLFPIEVSAYVSLTEKGQEAEMMGTFLLLGQILSWLPPLVFTMMNERGLSMSLGMGSMGLFFGLAVLCLLCMGSYDDALQTLEAVNRNHRRDDSGLDSPTTAFHPVPSDEGLKPVDGVIT